MITCEFNDLTKFSGGYYKEYFVYSSLLVLFVMFRNVSKNQI